MSKYYVSLIDEDHSFIRCLAEFTKPKPTYSEIEKMIKNLEDKFNTKVEIINMIELAKEENE